MQARVDWVLIISEPQVIKKKRSVRSVFPDYLSVSYDYALINIMFAKLTTVGLPEMKLLMNKGYDVIISVYDVTNKILLQDSSNVVAVVM